MLGIIDFTQVYNGKKKIAHQLKKIIHDKTLLSTIRSDPYSLRFVEFINDKVLFLPKMNFAPQIENQNQNNEDN